jgi:hypothetical protein
MPSPRIKQSANMFIAQDMSVQFVLRGRAPLVKQKRTKTFTLALTTVA